MKLATKILMWAACLVALAVWLVFVWPTQWEHYKQGNHNIRVNRFTGKTEVLDVLYNHGWVDLSDTDVPARTNFLQGKASE